MMLQHITVVVADAVAAAVAREHLREQITGQITQLTSRRGWVRGAHTKHQAKPTIVASTLLLWCYFVAETKTEATRKKQSNGYGLSYSRLYP